MIQNDNPANLVQRALLVGAFTETAKRAEAASLLSELEELVDTLGVPVGERMLVQHRETHARYLVGSGKAEELAALAKSHGCDVIIFDNELSPSQQRNWEKLAGVSVIDRTEVILDIFARRAHTREARLQVELAQLEYSLPRLTRAWGHLVRQGGGIGARGEGETQLEQDKRRVRGAIDRCRRELEQVRAARATQRKDRKRAPVPNAAIVGYTNAGKSSLLRRLTGAEVLVEDKLFATLDTTTRKIALPNHQPLLLTDTVGFVRRLPHGLVEAFRATLEEATLADFLIHLLDASEPEVMEHYNTTMRVLAELGADERRMIVAFNKIDRIEDPTVLANLRRHFPASVFVSVHSGAGLEELVDLMAAYVAEGSLTVELRIPQSEGSLISRIHRQGKVLESEYLDDAVRLLAVLPARLAQDCERWITSPESEKRTRFTESLETK